MLTMLVPSSAESALDFNLTSDLYARLPPLSLNFLEGSHRWYNATAHARTACLEACLHREQ
jgi:hypothetical protein